MDNQEYGHQPNDPEWNKKRRQIAEHDRDDTGDDQEDADDFIPSDGVVDRNIGEGSEDFYDIDDFDDDLLD